MNDGTKQAKCVHDRPGSLERDPKHGVQAQEAALRNLGACSGPCSLASRLEWHMVGFRSAIWDSRFKPLPFPVSDLFRQLPNNIPQ